MSAISIYLKIAKSLEKNPNLVKTNPEKYLKIESSYF
jgi:hypothetical protein